MKNAIFTITTGEGFQKIAQYTHPIMRGYANRIDAEVYVVSKARYNHCHFDKFRIYELLDRFDRILYMDSDILIHPDCPNLFEMVPPDKFGIFDEGAPSTEEERKTQQAAIEKASQEYEIPLPERRDFYNAGLMVVSQCHKELFKAPEKIVFMEYGDQPLLNLRLLHSEHEVHDIGYKFNRMPYMDSKVEEPRTDSYMIHYAGVQQVIPEIIKDVRLLYGAEQQTQITPPTRLHMLDHLELDGKKCVEVGSFKGSYACSILERNPGELWLVDPWAAQPDDIYPDDFSNGKLFQDFDGMYYDVVEMFQDEPRVHIIRDFSINAARKFKDESFDFVYIDAIHTLESVLVDMTTWWPKVKRGGWMCGHDYTGAYPGVPIAVNTFCKIIHQELSLLVLEKWASWGIHKK